MKPSKRKAQSIILPPDFEFSGSSFVIQRTTPSGIKETVFEMTAPPEIKKQIKKRKEEIKHFAYQLATDAIFTGVGFLIPEVGIATLPSKLLRMGKTAEAIAEFLVNVDKIKAFRYLKPFAEEFKFAFSVWGGEHIVSQFTEKVKPTPLFHLYKDFLLGRAFLGVAGRGLKAGFKTSAIISKKLIDYAYGKFPKLPEYVNKAINVFYKTFTGISYEAWKTLDQLKGVQTHLLEAGMMQKLFSALDNPEVAKELEEYFLQLRGKIHEGSKFISKDQLKVLRSLIPGFDEEKLKQLSDVVFLYFLLQDNLTSPIVGAFIEKTLQGEYNAPVFNKMFWETIKTEYKDLWEESKQAFVDNAWRMVRGAVAKVREGLKVPKKKPVKEKELDNKARTILRHLFKEDMAKYRSGRVTILHYLFKPLFELYEHDPFLLLTQGLKVDVQTKKLAQMIETLNNKKQQSFSLFLEKLCEYAYNHATDLSFIRDRAWQLLKGDLRGLERLWNNELKKSVEEFYEQYIPRIGFKHYMLAPAMREAKFTDVVEALDLDKIYSEHILEHMARFSITRPLKPRFYQSIEDILSIGIPKAIVDTLREYPHLINEPEKLAKAVIKEFGFTGGLTIPKWIANRFIIPKFMDNLYRHIDEILAHPEIEKKLGDPLIGKQEFTLMDKKVKMTTGMLDALKDYFMAITGRNAQAWQESKLYTFNRWMKRFILFWSPLFHSTALTLSGLAIAGRYKMTAWDIVGRAFLDSLQVMTRGLSHPEFGYMAKEVNQVINDLAKQGYKINEIILSGWNEGEALWGNYILAGKNILHELLQKGDQQAFKEVAKEFEKFEKELKVDKLFNIAHAPERWLWAGYYQALKLRTAYNLVNAYKKGLMTVEDLVQNLNTINYIFGGLHTWFYVNPKHAQLYRFFFFAPDWYLTLFHNFRTWLHGDSPLVANFFPTILRMRFYLSVYANYAFNGHSPWDNYNLQDPKEWLRLFMKDWTELFKIHIPIVDSRGHYRVFTLNLLGFDIEPLEMLGILPFMKNLHDAITHPTMSIDQRFLKVTLGTAKEWLEFWFKKGSMMLRTLFKLYEATKPKFSSTKEEGTTFTEAFYDLVQGFAPLAVLQLIAPIRYPYQATPENREAMLFAVKLSMLGMKNQVQDNLTELLFENRNRPHVVSEILKDWLNSYREIKQAQKELGLTSRKAKDVYQSLITSLSHAYYNYYLYPWLKKNAHKNLSEIKEEAKNILNMMKEDIQKSALPAKVKHDLWHSIRRRFKGEIRDAYRAIAKRDLPDIIEKKIKERRGKEIEEEVNE
jgi:gas vesicle protein